MKLYDDDNIFEIITVHYPLWRRVYWRTKWLIEKWWRNETN